MSNQANPSTSSSDQPTLLSTPNALINTLTSFVTVLIHQILYLRHIYPARSFLSARAYNYPVRQSRHPSVCAWINSAVAALQEQLARGVVKEVSVVIFGAESNGVMERWRVGLAEVPGIHDGGDLGRGDWSKRGAGDVPFVRGEREQEDDQESTANPLGYLESALAQPISIVDLEAHFRAVLSRLNATSTRLKPLPDDEELTFTVALEVRDSADAPVGIIDKEERKWIAQEPEPWPEDDPDTEQEEDDFTDDEDEDKTPKGAKKPTSKTKDKSTKPRTLPVRRLEAGELRLQIWVEEGIAKDRPPKEK